MNLQRAGITIGLSLLALAGCSGEGRWDELNEAGRVALEERRFEAADRFFGRALELARNSGRRDERLIASLSNLAQAKQLVGQSDEALSLLREAVDLDVELESEPARIARNMSRLALSYQEREQPDQARELFERALSIQREGLEGNHLDLCES